LTTVRHSQTLPLHYRWIGELPRRAMRQPTREARPPIWTGGQLWLDTGAHNQPFDFGAHTQRLMQDIVQRCPELAHIDVSRVLVGVLQARSGQPHGLQARVTPLRFAQGALQKQRRGVVYQVQRYFHDEREFLYLMTFCLPRFLDQEFDDKLITIFHEMYHIGPRCDGDLRRFHGRCQLHTHSKVGYDKHMAGLARAYLQARPDPRLHAYLRFTFAQLQQRHGSVVGVVVPRPKVIPLLGAAASQAASPGVKP
jgi:hypothetical protein